MCEVAVGVALSGCRGHRRGRDGARQDHTDDSLPHRAPLQQTPGQDHYAQVGVRSNLNKKYFQQKYGIDFYGTFLLKVHCFQQQDGSIQHQKFTHN